MRDWVEVSFPSRGWCCFIFIFNSSHLLLWSRVMVSFGGLLAENNEPLLIFVEFLECFNSGRDTF